MDKLATKIPIVEPGTEAFLRSVAPGTSGAKALIRNYWRDAGEVFRESFWPTACLSCNEPGVLLCESCRAKLRFIDAWETCPRCGSPHGRLQCCQCNPVTLASAGIKELPYASCRSAVPFEGLGPLLVRHYKDRGEQRLADFLSACMIEQVIPELHGKGSRAANALSYIPATAAALRRRGFDHVQLLAERISEHLGLPCIEMFERPKNRDQRLLARKKRFANIQGRFRIKKDATPPPPSLLLIDDVYTTGSTLIAASAALLDAGVKEVHCLTFARVP